MSFLHGIPLVGTIVNTVAIVIGSLIGFVVHSHINKDIMKLPVQCVGIFTAALGIQMILQSQNMLILVFSLCAGAIIGGVMDIDGRIERVIQCVQDRFKDSGSTFTEGFITAMLIFCIGSMAVLGAFEEGLGGYPKLLFTKTMIDFMTSIALTVTFGIGVMFAAVPVLIYEGGLSLAARLLQPYMTEAATIEMTAVGGVLLVGVGLSCLGLTKMKLMNGLPGLVLAVLLAQFFIG